ncbi:conserved hypothetical protein [Rippkaea orientalis PCC 8801]|uniref:Uncharacterized protein n=1 Tax=Rippkaea orientalis (strain PCC 8801 / RF-1) TaxID=41431 RepID=B7JUQ9_RIPO1|nr:hypothetical protein [Rippkaea orientalis]ACK65603.1 conserved hypothetical protein [Rippkaea orientalis PCC 8801]
MARYTSSYLVNASLNEIPTVLVNILESCGFELVYQAVDYMMAREIPGQVSYSKLVVIEVLIDSTKAKAKEVPITWVVKNDELPLQMNNHCQQRFEQIQQTISEDKQWHLIASVAN